MKQRARGCLVGQLVGDALGSLVEFQSAHQIARSYPDGVRELRDGGTWDTIAGQPTDDGEMALSLARSLVERDAFELEHVAQQYANWLASDPFDRGNTISRALAAGLTAMRAGESVAEACRRAANADSQANGALMRISPLAIFGAAHGDLVSWARADAELTHPHPACLDANEVFVVAIAAALEGAEPTEIYRAACERAAATGVEATLRAAKQEPPEGSDSRKAGWVLIALQGAFFELLHAPSFEDALLRTIARGGDTDTTAAITGALYGAAVGIDAIPRRYRETLTACQPRAGDPRVQRPRPERYWPTDVLELADRLLRAG
jgi:ADP-ribosyl-[dinitrogen reductase] hydrolase